MDLIGAKGLNLASEGPLGRTGIILLYNKTTHPVKQNNINTNVDNII